MWPSHLSAGGGAGDRDAALLLEVHVVHGGAVAAALHFFDLVDAAGVEQDPLAERRLARVDVGGNADVAKLFEVHVYLSLSRKLSGPVTPGKHEQRRVAVVGPGGKIHRERRAEAYSGQLPLTHSYSTLSIG